MTEKKRRGRPPGSGKNRPKVSPLVEEKMEDSVQADAWDAKNLEQRLPEEEFVPSKMEAIAPVVEDLMLVKEKLEQLKPKPTQYDPFKNPRFKEKMGLKDK